VDRFQARWDLQTGLCTLVRLSGDNAKEEKLDMRPTPLHGPGTYQLRFANFDQRLTVWVNQNLPFGDGVNYPRPWHYDTKEQKWVNAGPTANDLKRPASLASKGAAVQVRHLKLWRDTYYTIPEQQESHSFGPTDGQLYRSLEGKKAWGDSTAWGELAKMPVATMYVQPGHYLCLGDNSQQSSDSRSWGTVPERLLLGRALVVYYPFNRIEVIH
jgi:signal peptidase I